MDALPNEVLVHIFSFFSFDELSIIHKVCKKWNECADDSALWKYLCVDDYGIEEKSDPDFDWKQQYLYTKKFLFTREAVARHRSSDDIWVIYEKKVYNITPFIESHPGGEEFLMQYAGQDVTKAFNEGQHIPGIISLLHQYYQGDLLVPRRKLIEEDAMLAVKSNKAEIVFDYLVGFLSNPLANFLCLCALIRVIGSSIIDPLLQ